VELGSQIVFLFLATMIQSRALSIVHEITGRRGGGALDYLLMSMDSTDPGESFFYYVL
jgi:hypothetical protein